MPIQTKAQTKNERRTDTVARGTVQKDTESELGLLLVPVGVC